MWDIQIYCSLIILSYVITYIFYKYCYDYIMFNMYCLNLKFRHSKLCNSLSIFYSIIFLK